MRMRVLTKKLRVEIENEMRVFLESLNFEIEMRVLQKSAVTPSPHAPKIGLPLGQLQSSKDITKHAAITLKLLPQVVLP